MTGTIRFAPSTTGHAHPGTLLSALLCWLDARSGGKRFMIRLENLDPERCRPEFADAMLDDLAWFGLEWDKVVYQHREREHHEAALDVLASRGVLYPCACSRAKNKDRGRVAADGGFVYDRTCRHRTLPADGWRSCPEPLRLKLPDDAVTIHDASGSIYHQHPVHDMGDPVVRRRDGAVAYHLACVVDDERTGVKELIRGRDLLPSAPVQVLLQRLLGYPMPQYRHHFLFLEDHDSKLSKFHGAVAVPALRAHYSGEQLCGMIAFWAGLLPSPAPCRPADLLGTFSWERVRREDVTLSWDGTSLNARTTGDGGPYPSD